MDGGLGWVGGGGANIDALERDFGRVKGFVDGLDGACVMRVRSFRDDLLFSA